MKEIKARARQTHSSAEANIAARNRAVAAAGHKIRDGQQYFIRRHGGWFRPEAHGYTNDIAMAGLFDAATARGYLDVEGLSVVALSDMKVDIWRELQAIIGRCATLTEMAKQI